MRARGISGLLAAAGCLAAALVLRQGIEEERRDLGLEQEGISAAGSRAGRELTAAAAGLGVFRAVAVDFFWLRAIRLQKKGEYFESESLARLILRLQPRIASAWTFQAEQLAYDIPPSFPPAERWPWVLSGIALLRDEALVLNPGSLAVHAELGKIFYHKIGLDADEAGPLYRSELAKALDVEEESPAWKRKVREWGISLERWKAIQDGLDPTVDLDLRVSGCHALYWAEAGLESGRDHPRGLAVTLLEGYRLGAILQLYAGGRPIQGPAGRSFAFLPDLRLERAARAVLEDAVARRQAAPELAADLAWRSIVYAWLLGDAAEAERRFVEEARAWPSPPASAGDLAADILFPALRGGKKEAFLDALSASLEASALLEASGEATAARGLASLARAIRARGEAAMGAGALPSLEDCDRAVRSRLASRWGADPRGRPFVERVRRGIGPRPSAEALGLPEPRELPFHAEMLDPVREPAGARR
jgi:hypothetical protein